LNIVPQSPVAAIETTVNKTHTWLKELAELGSFEDESQAYTALRAALHSIRDRLTVDEATHLGAQLPMLLRGVYYGQYKPANMPIKFDSEQMIQEIQERVDQPSDPARATKAFYAVVGVLKKRISEGEMNYIISNMPPDLQEMVARSR
jgi:uncharacterized protein (DUF2267 family)